MIDKHDSHEEKNHYNKKYKGNENTQWPYDMLFRAAHNQFILWVMAVVNQNRPIKILDLGCGDGKRTRFLGHYSNIELIGIDISKSGIELANKNKIGNSSYYLMDADNINFNSNYFDLIIDYGSFSSLDMGKTWGKLIDLIKPNGSIIGIETLGENPIYNFKRKVNVKKHIRTKSVINKVINLNQLFNWSNDCNNFKYRTFGFLSPMLAPLLWVKPKMIFLDQLINLFDWMDNHFWLRFLLFQQLSFKVVFYYKGIK